MKLPLLIFFAPERWSELDKFTKFWPSTYDFNHQTRKRLAGVGGHFQKAITLRSLAKRLEPTLAEDEEEVKSKGYSPVRRSREVAALIETIFCELYSVLDCARFVLQKVYAGYGGIRKSTRSTFQNGQNGEIDIRVPLSIRDAFKNTKSWYPELLRLRDEITHSDTGSCHVDKDTGEVFYMHEGLGDPTKAFVLYKVFEEIEKYITHISAFLGDIFQELNRSLSDKPLRHLCVMNEGRMYERTVAWSTSLDFNSGKCESLRWFDQLGNPECPLKASCGAYARAKQIEQSGVDSTESDGDEPSQSKLTQPQQ